VDKAIITAHHQIAYDIELFPFQQRDNSNDPLQFLQWLLKRKTASISNTALDNDHLNSATTERVFITAGPSTKLCAWGG
jgi:hypothetical protein